MQDASLPACLSTCSAVPLRAVAVAGPVSHLQLCESCFQGELGRVQSGMKARLPAGVSLTDLVATPIAAWQLKPESLPDMENEFFDTRQAFLSLCQGNHYQFDTLRRAKHSSMMVVYHLHNPSAPAFASTCNTCRWVAAPGAPAPACVA